MNVPFPASRLAPDERARRVNVILGPTNTGKTHYAIERLVSHQSGMIGLPLRLLAREVYDRVVARVGVGAVALVTGEEKIKPKGARYWVSTVEAMPRDLDLAFVAIDEIQLAADLDRGYTFTDRLLNRRGREETLLIGASTMQRTIEHLLPGAHIYSRPRLSKLSFAGERKIARLPRRSAVVAFSAEEVYAIAEWIRRQRGGAAVVLGALSPRTRNAQVEMFQNGDVDYLVATDAIGMGLNLDLDHIAFAADRKFDGRQYRQLSAAEFGQIAGRAGRHLRDGTFGTTGRCTPFDEELVEALEDHRFDSIKMLQWRNSNLDFSSLESLAASLDVTPKEQGLTRAPIAQDQMVFDVAARDEAVRRVAKTRADIARLWEACQIPDYRKVSPSAHADLVLSIYGFVVRAGHIPEDWLARHVNLLDRVDGDLDALSARIAQVRTWTYVANRNEWLADPEHWQALTRRIEDTLSDALHARLAQRFVDRRASVLMRRLRENAMLEAEVTSSGDVLVEGQHVGALNGFRFTPDPLAAGEAAKALNAAALKALAGEIEGRATRVHEAVDEAFVLANDGYIRWLGEPVGKIGAGAHVLEPQVRVLSDDQLTGPALEMVQRRLDLWLAQQVKKLLGPLVDLEKGEGLEGMARGIAFQVAEALGVLERARVAEDVKALPQEARGALRKLGVRFGAYHLYLPNLLKPAPRALAAQLWALRHAGSEELKGLDEVPHLASSGRTSFVADAAVPKGFYRAAGFRVCGDRAVRVDILERLADLIRPAVAYRPGTTPGDPPLGTADNDGFVVTVAMTSLAGCSGESFASILRSLGYVLDRRKGPAITKTLVPKAATEPAKPVELVEAEPVEAAAPDAPSLEASAEEPGATTETAAEAVETTSAPEPVAAQEAEPAPDPMPEAATAETPAEALSASPAEPDAEAPSPVLETDLAVLGAEPEPEAVPVEEPLIEVWRPHRQHHHARRPDQRGNKDRGPRRGPPVAAVTVEPGAEQTPTPDQRPSKPWRGKPRHEGRPRPPAEGSPAAASAPAADVQTQVGPGPGAPPQKPRFDPRRGKEGHEGRPRPQAGHGRPDDRRPNRAGSFATTEKPKSRDRLPDPNSPFAKLLALKEQMEKKDG